ncbi:ferritin-like domain-containing protein [Leptodesmis sichuanensis]|uniref:ferritin-like domain-containing protein n=1 Tax=Leptodesmis sichuanensis TaxID=2906798 RepID=UPI001F1F3F44|nr:ferritin-like domain-containing protein [Leptodesmis sichuanensis]UIE39649.1 ferritin-like domain-containing protein [Leptodesmis sichuanensis A121]
MKLGTEAHKELFCQSFLDSHLTYEPETIPWPELDEEALARLRGIPFWRVALETEQQAGVMVNAFAETVQDPLIKQAIALQAQEESRHGRLLEFLIQHYGIEIPEPTPTKVPTKPEQEFVDFGFGECLDSFFAFGLFGLARQSGYFPESLFTIFDAIVHEEARHIVFFVNWVTYHQMQQGWGADLFRGIHASWHYSRALLHLAKSFGSDGGSGGDSFTAASSNSFIDNLTPEKVFSMCLQENERRMSQFDDRLLQPRLFPRLAAIALQVLKLLPQGRSTPNTQISHSKL